MNEHGKGRNKASDTFNSQTIMEESSPMGTSKSSSSKQEYMFGGNTGNLSMTHSDLFMTKDQNLEGTNENDLLRKDVKSQTMTLSQLKNSGLSFNSTEKSGL